MLMKHPDFPDRKPTQTTKVAFENVWKQKGWVLSDEPFPDRPEVEEAPQIVPEPEMEAPRTQFLETKTRTELNKVAEELGIDGYEDLDDLTLREIIENIPEFYARDENDSPVGSSEDPALD